jgi:hypothetical protein
MGQTLTKGTHNRLFLSCDILRAINSWSALVATFARGQGKYATIGELICDLVNPECSRVESHSVQSEDAQHEAYQS